MTYIWAGKRWAYLAVVLDLFSRKPVGWAMSFFPDSALTAKALSMAWEARGKPANLLYHSGKVATIPAGISDSYCGDIR
ncbi:IS911 ORF2 [Yersinia frederiksenii ATCC 33641]|nr:IS911 ORF2 [Yersinia frederiksenii ATCC 33641]